MSSKFKSIIITFLCIFSIGINAQNTYTPNNTAYLNVNPGRLVFKNDTVQQISFYGCNTSITLNKNGTTGPKGIEGPNGFKWQKRHQIGKSTINGIKSKTNSNSQPHSQSRSTCYKVSLYSLAIKHTFLKILPAYPLKSSNLFNFRERLKKGRGHPHT